MAQALLSLDDRSFLTPSVTSRGVVLPDPGNALLMGDSVPEGKALTDLYDRIRHAKNPVLFPGPLVLWRKTPDSPAMAAAVKRLSAVSGMKIIPMADYRPKYPKINPETEINPSHPNLTIWHNKIDLCIFVGVHCHYANIALKIIRGGTSCFTVALCSYAGDDEAHLTIRDLTPEKVLSLAEIFAKKG